MTYLTKAAIASLKTDFSLAPSAHYKCSHQSGRCGFCPSAPSPFPQRNYSPSSSELPPNTTYDLSTPKLKLTNTDQGPVAESGWNEILVRQPPITPTRHARRCGPKKNVIDWFRKRIQGQRISRQQASLEGPGNPTAQSASGAKPSMEGAIGVWANKAVPLNNRGGSR